MRGDFSRRGDARGSGREGRGGRDHGCEGRGVGTEWRARATGRGRRRARERTAETSACARVRELGLTEAHGALADGGF